MLCAVIQLFALHFSLFNPSFRYFVCILCVNSSFCGILIGGHYQISACGDSCVTYCIISITVVNKNYSFAAVDGSANIIGDNVVVGDLLIAISVRKDRLRSLVGYAIAVYILTAIGAFASCSIVP